MEPYGRTRPSAGAGSGGSRYGEMARALDAHLAGKSYRETAALLWGAEAVADWHPDDALRSRVRRRVASARALMKGGYRELLPKA